MKFKVLAINFPSHYPRKESRKIFESIKICHEICWERKPANLQLNWILFWIIDPKWIILAGMGKVLNDFFCWLTSLGFGWCVRVVERLTWFKIVEKFQIYSEFLLKKFHPEKIKNIRWISNTKRITLKKLTITNQFIIKIILNLNIFLLFSISKYLSIKFNFCKKMYRIFREARGTRKSWVFNGTIRVGFGLSGPLINANFRRKKSLIIN